MALVVNGRRFSHASAEITLKGIRGSAEIFIDIQEIGYSDALEIVLVYGTNQAPIGITSGQYKPGEATLKMGKSSFQKMIAKIGDGWLGSNLQVVAKYNDAGEPQVVDTFVGPIIGAEDSSSAGPDQVQTTVKIQPLYVLRNGIKPLQNHFGV
jgi:hypothetical protein